MDTSATQEDLLTVCELTKYYTKDRPALKDVSFDLKRGELVSIIGPSGSGKSTLLRCINRMIDATSGSIVFNEQEVLKLKYKKLRMMRRKISMVFQHYNLVHRLTTIENVLHGRLGYKSSIAGMLGSYTEEEKMQALEILAQLDIVEYAYVRTDQLSGGQKQRVGIARALVQDPLLMLCDEPIASLDPKSSRTIMGYLRAIVDTYGISCLVNLHQVDFAMEYSDRIIALHDGKKVFDGAPQDLTTSIIKEVYDMNSKDGSRVLASQSEQFFEQQLAEQQLQEELETLLEAPGSPMNEEALSTPALQETRAQELVLEKKHG